MDPYAEPARAGAVCGNGGPGGISAERELMLRIAPVAALAHARQHVLREQPRRPVVHFLDLLELLERPLLERLVAAERRVVHHDVDGAEITLDVGDQRLASAVGTREVDDVHAAARARGFDERERFLEA